MPLRRYRRYAATNSVAEHDNSATPNARQPLHLNILCQITFCDQSSCQALPMLEVHIVLPIIRTRAIHMSPCLTSLYNRIGKPPTYGG
ncbi:hypothetical protein L484_006093 [Morus notabilis]|uniref:Uncharacterized protein n=1 Tax=Morus notabilis TaxID=981085 RepID=W9S2Y5_9ROSA|nr:hypothetical protein L484_006093 [Morus notabilis]